MSWDSSLSAEQKGLIERYLDDLLAYNATTNLTASANRSDLLSRHIADGLAAVPILKRVLKTESPDICDLGCGGGFIGFAVKIAWPQARVTLVESLKRKYDFLNLAAAHSGLKGLRVLRARAGAGAIAGAPPEGFDVVIERALAPLPEALKLAFPLTAENGFVAAYQSQAPDDQEPELKKTLAGLSARLVESCPYRLPLESQDRYLALFARR